MRLERIYETSLEDIAMQFKVKYHKLPPYWPEEPEYPKLLLYLVVG